MKRVGVMIPHTDTTLERDLQSAFRDRTSLHSERLWLAAVTVADEERMLQEEVPRAIRYLEPLGPAALVFGCTSAGALRGALGERQFTNWMEREIGCPVVSAFGSVAQVVKRRIEGRVLVLSPYSADVHRTMCRALSDAAIDVVEGPHMDLDNDIDIGRKEPGEIAAFVERYFSSAGDVAGVFISCTNLRAAETVGDLEAALKYPVVTSNTAIIEELERLV